MSAPEIVFLIVILLAGAATLTLLLRTRGERKKKPPKAVRPARAQEVHEVPGLMPEDSDDVSSLYHWEPEQWIIRCPYCDCENEDTALFCKACGRPL